MRRRQRARDAIVEAATSLFQDQGIHGTRIEDITERADVAKGAFYSHFASKDALVADLLRKGVRRLLAEYLAGIQSTAAAPQMLSRIVERHEAFFSEHPVQAVLFHQARGVLYVRGASRHPLRAVFEEYLSGLAAILGHSPRDARTAEELAAVVGGAIVGYRSLRIAAGLPVRAAAVSAVLRDGVPPVPGRRRPGSRA